MRINTASRFELPRDAIPFDPSSFSTIIRATNPISVLRNETLDKHPDLVSNIEKIIMPFERTIAAYALAVKYHGEQMYGSITPYIAHLAGVVSRMSTESEIIVAYLHDLFEDTECLLRDIKDIVNDEELVSLNVLTKGKPKEGESKQNYYERYVNAINANPIARKVKKWDLIYNLQSTIMEGGKVKNIPKYVWALRVLDPDAHLFLESLVPGLRRKIKNFKLDYQNVNAEWYEKEMSNFKLALKALDPDAESYLTSIGL